MISEKCDVFAYNLKWTQIQFYTPGAHEFKKELVEYFSGDTKYTTKPLYMHLYFALSGRAIPLQTQIDFSLQFLQFGGARAIPLVIPIDYASAATLGQYLWIPIPSMQVPPALVLSLPALGVDMAASFNFVFFNAETTAPAPFLRRV